MKKYRIDGETLTGIADAIRIADRETRKYKPSEMVAAVATMMDSPTYILKDASGNEHYAIYSDKEVVLTATANDIRKGKVAVTDSGLTKGNVLFEGDVMALQERTITRNGTYEPDKGYDGFSKISVNVDGGGSGIDDLLDEINGEVIGEEQYVVTFIGANGEQLYQLSVYEGDDCQDPVSYEMIQKPTKESTPTEIFTYSGWSLTAGGAAEDYAIRNVTSNRTVYAAFESAIRYYTVNFYDGETLLNTEEHTYGSSSTYVFDKTGASFDGWTASATNIQSDMNCYGEWEFASFATDDWETIIARSESGKADEYYSIGDERELELNYADGTSEKIVVRIVAFNHDKNANGESVGMTVIAKNALSTPILWGTTNYPPSDAVSAIHLYTKYGFDGSDIKPYIEDIVMPALPTALQRGLKPVLKYENQHNYITNSNHTICHRKVWIPSAREVLGYSNLPDKNLQYSYYSTVENRIATLFDSGETVDYWTSTVDSSESAYSISTDGEYKTSTVHSSELYIILGFCI